MKGVCFEQVEHVAVQDLPNPQIEDDQDAIVRVELAGLCGSDLHPFFGREVGLDPGTVMGHEFIGEVIAVGDGVEKVKVGERVCAPFTTSCGKCFYCQQGLTARCQSGQCFGWREQGIGLHGGQATHVRVPLAASTLVKIPVGISDDAALLLGDNLSTGFFAAEMAGIEDKGVYAVVGCGTVGLLTIAAARRLGATELIAVDPNPARLELAQSLGAIGCADDASAVDAILERTDGRGADGVMELVGLPAAQSLAYSLLRPGGTMSVIGCHCSPNFAFSPTDAYNKNLIYRTGRCSARAYMPRIAQLLMEEPMDLSWCVTHRFAIDQAAAAYDTFSNRREGCVKAVFTF